MGKRAYPPLPTRPQLVAVYPALFRDMRCSRSSIVSLKLSTPLSPLPTALVESLGDVVQLLVDFESDHFPLGFELSFVSIVEFPHAVDFRVHRQILFAATAQLLLAHHCTDHLLHME